MQEIEYLLSTLEVAEMLETEHWKLLRKLEGGGKVKGIITVLTDNNFVVSDFFIPSTYRDSSGKENKCYKVTKRGCEFLAHKSTGEKGVRFTARYINRFHEMENKLSEIAKPEISTEQMEQLLNFMEDQEKFNQMVIKKLESAKRIHVYQAESNREILTLSSMKGKIIRTVELVTEDRIIKMIYGFVIGLKENGNVEKRVY